MLRALLLVFLMLLAVPARAANPALDASADCVNGLQSGATTYTITCSTTTSDDVYIVYCRTVRSGGVAPTCTPSSSHLSFTKRVAYAESYTSAQCANNGACQSDDEEWWAPVTGTLSSEVITITLSSATYATTFAIGKGVTSPISTVTPFDTNASLPAMATVAGGGNNSLNTNTALSTTNATDVLLFFAGGNNALNWNNAYDATHGQWTAIDSRYCQSFFGGCNGQLVTISLSGLAVAATQSSLVTCTTTTGGCTGSASIVFADAIAGPTPAAGGGGTLPLIGVE
jgi:hypothetical protein